MPRRLRYSAGLRAPPKHQSPSRSPPGAPEPSGQRSGRQDEQRDYEVKPGLVYLFVLCWYRLRGHLVHYFLVRSPCFVRVVTVDSRDPGFIGTQVSAVAHAQLPSERRCQNGAGNGESDTQIANPLVAHCRQQNAGKPGPEDSACLVTEADQAGARGL